MVELLKKEEVIFEHDGKGNLLPVVTTLVAKLPGDKEFKNIKVIPMRPDQLIEFSERANSLKSESKTDLLQEMDNEIILQYVYEPKFDAADVKAFKPIEKQIISATVLKASGFETDINAKINESLGGSDGSEEK